MAYSTGMWIKRLATRFSTARPEITFGEPILAILRERTPAAPALQFLPHLSPDHLNMVVHRVRYRIDFTQWASASPNRNILSMNCFSKLHENVNAIRREVDKIRRRSRVDVSPFPYYRSKEPSSENFTLRMRPSSRSYSSAKWRSQSRQVPAEAGRWVRLRRLT